MSTQTNHERPSRNLKSESRLYNFLSPSRSRSRPKDSAQKPSQDASSGPDSPDSKPSARIASRPLSSTTNATITPGTPKAIPQLLAPIILPQPPSAHLEPQGSAAAKPSNARKKLHILFGISLSSPKKSSFASTASQPDSSRSSFDIPPLPTHPLTSGSVSKPNSSFSRPHSPNTLSKMRQNGARLSSSLTDISNVQCAGASTMFHKIFSGSKGTRTSDKPPILVSGPIRRSSRHRSTSSESRRPTTDRRLRGHEPSHSLPGSSLPPPPHIIYTPATPDRRATAIASLPSPSTSDSRKLSLDSTSRSRKGKERATSVRHPTTADAKSPKGPGLDFENPNGTAVAGSESGLSNTSEWKGHAASTGRERESTFGPGMAGVGTLQREMSLRRGKEREEQIRAREAERKQLFQQQRKHKHEQFYSQDVQTDHANGSTSTVATGHSSSWGRATGKRSALSGRTGSGTGLPKLSTLTQHPAFDFEPPVPSRNASSIGALHDVSSSCDKSGEEGKQIHKTGSTEERQPMPLSSQASLGHRSALKGRSLDLGLGLAWAPSSVREEALLPVLNVGRSFSQSSSANGSNNTARSASSNSHGNAKRDAIYEEPDNVEVSKLGKEVAAVFKNTLDHDGFVNFRKYVNQFDAHEIPFDGPTGIIARVEQLLGESSSLKPHEKRQLMDQLVRIILRNA